MTKPLLSVANLSVTFDIPRRGAMPWTPKDALRAVDSVSFDLRPGETLGIVGESGCGKSTLARAILRLLPSHGGTVMWLGQDLLRMGKADLHTARRDIQMVFQDPLASLDPRMTVGQIVAEPLITHYPNMTRAERDAKVHAVLERVGILRNMVNRYPHEFSGGQCQRIGIARALVMEPKLIVCDEPVSALDVSIQAQVINLLMDLQNEMGLSLIFIAHDLSVVKHISDHVMVLYLGIMVEMAASDALYANPRHPYTQALIASVPVPDPNYVKPAVDAKLAGDLPSPLSPPSGCVFRTRCKYATDLCATEKPKPQDAGDGNLVACHHWRDL